jgi:hypothetical protein
MQGGIVSWRFICFVLLLAGVWLSGCSLTAPPPPGTTPTPAPDLPESASLTDSGFKISYPAGWVVRSNGSTTLIEEHANACDLHDGVCVVHDHLSMAALAEMGLPEQANLQAMLVLNRHFFTWKELTEPEETQVFGAPALGLHYYDDGVYGYILMGYVNNEGFLLNIAAPTEEGLEQILPTFTAMRASITPE